MKLLKFESKLWVPAPRDQVFEFFSNPENLERLTPDWLRFRILTPRPIEVRAGTIIDYRLRIHGLPVRWRSEITRWEPPYRFVDEQLRGPYRTWIHLHTFEEDNGGTLIGDEVSYWPLGGRLIDWLFVRRDVKRIFRYRTDVLRKLFGDAGETEQNPIAVAS